MYDIEKKISQVIKQHEKNFDKSSLKQYEKSLKDFNKLVKQGIIKPRGYCLRTINTQQCSFFKH